MTQKLYLFKVTLTYQDLHEVAIMVVARNGLIAIERAVTVRRKAGYLVNFMDYQAERLHEVHEIYTK